MKEASGVVKRLNVTIQWLEERFTITKGACKIFRGLARQKSKVPSNRENHATGHYAAINEYEHETAMRYHLTLGVPYEVNSEEVAPAST